MISDPQARVGYTEVINDESLILSTVCCVLNKINDEADWSD